MVMQNSTPAAVNFKFSLQYSSGGTAVYDCIAEKNVISGTWTQLANTSYTIPAGAANPVLYIETAESTCDFFVDEIAIAADGVTITAGQPEIRAKRGDVNQDGKVDAADAKTMQQYLLCSDVTVNLSGADLDESGRLNAADLSLLKRILTAPPEETTTSPTVTEPQQSGEHKMPKEYMEEVSSKYTAVRTSDVPADVQRGNTGSEDRISYYSKHCGRNKPAIVWLPAGYSTSKKYPVLYMNHGVMGNETSMLTGFAVQEMASQLAAKGEAVPFIIVFTQMYSSKTSANPGGFDMNTMDGYDEFLYDLTESLMPYVEEHYSVATGKENTAIAGFSMGGRESLYIGMSRPDLFGYVCASSPAPGIVPTRDTYMTHEGSYLYGTNRRMTNADFKIAGDQLPYLLMIAGGTNDMVVGTYPKEYHNLFTASGTTHLWTEVPGGTHDGSVGIPLFYNFFRAVFKA